MSASTTTTVAELLPTIASRAAEIEAARRVPRDLLDDLKAAGCFGVLVPTSHGGAGADIVTAMRLYEDLAAADASVAWIVMIGGGAWCDLVTLPRATFDAVFAKGPGVIVAGAFNPAGSITPVNGGVPGRGPMGVRQRVRARRLDLRQLRRRARGRPPDAPRRPVHAG